MSELRKCAWCGLEFQPKRSDGLFHGVSCKQAYWRWKHRVDLFYAQANQAINALEERLGSADVDHTAERYLGALSDKLAAMGFEASDKQMSLPESAYVLSNQLGE